AIAPQGKPLPPVQGFAGTVATKMVIAPRRDPEFKGMTERNNQYFETSFLPGRDFRSPQDFNTQLSHWLAERANQRKIRSLGDRPDHVLDRDLTAMTALPPHAPSTGFAWQIRLARGYYVRFDTHNSSSHPTVVGGPVQVRWCLGRVSASSDGTVVWSLAR